MIELICEGKVFSVQGAVVDMVTDAFTGTPGRSVALANTLKGC